MWWGLLCVLCVCVCVCVCVCGVCVCVCVCVCVVCVFAIIITIMVRFVGWVVVSFLACKDNLQINKTICKL